ncbi:transcription factor bHLH148-like [Phalaenopsis equestris]|uniref:transcription factor bHLH148-like n=1 Tax=Phalaenopsis equestris TaxID=78828 RepID=UPI0009E4FD2A|nr:transcription factor bHLH148-like [Phalaenopsis equestris]
MTFFITDGNPSAKNLERKQEMSKTELRPLPKKWHTSREQNTYSSKLIETLVRVRRSTPVVEAPRRTRAIREAADRILAIAGRGQSRWSRAILSSRNLNLKQRNPLTAVCCPSQPKFFSAGYDGFSVRKMKRSHFLKCKARVLGRLVPGCRRVSFPTLLEEASDYIAALQMQVRAMAALTTILSSSGGFYPPEPDRSVP